MLKEITAICQELLSSYPGAEETRHYLESRADIKSQEDFQIGYFPNHKELHLLTEVIDEERLIKLGLLHFRFSEEEARFFTHSSLENHNLVFPYKDHYGKIIALVGRSILSEEERKIEKISKYKNTRFHKSDHLFGLWRAKQAILEKGAVFVVEGQFDCISAVSKGIDNCVCLGSGSMSFGQFSLLSRYTDKIILLLDNDAAGQKGTERAIEKFGNDKIRRANIPDGYKDIDQFLSETGNEALEYLNNFII